jgi:hypothetical protein
MADDQLSALFAEPTDAPEGSEPHDDPTKPESEPPAEPAEPQAEPKEPEPEPKEDEDGEPAADRQGNVSFQALQRERDKRREIQAKLDAQQAMIQRIEGRFQQFQLQQQQQPQQQPQRPPTVDEDPIAVLRQVAEDRQQTIQEKQQAKARQEFEGHIAGFEAQFRPQAPDYDDAAIFLAQRRDQDLIDAGHLDPKVRKEIMYHDMAVLAVNAVQRGVNPAQVAYNMAKRWGYQPQGQQAQGQQAQQAQQDAPPRAPNGQFQAAEQKLEMAERGQQASRSLSAGGGRAPPGLTVEALDAMSDDDFWQVAHDEKKWRKVWGADQ